jgi:[acyl-carrier-protein] S-malonyltransferase
MTYALTFPGQGSQSIGMLQELLATHTKIVTDTLTESSDAIGIDLLSLCQEGPAESINQTSTTQPLMLSADIAVWRVLQSECELKPSLLAGHSLGEYAALVVAESLNLVDATQIVRHRGELMQQAVPEGVAGVAAILGLENQTVVDICEQLCDEEIVSAVNFNAPGQVVIAGHKNKVSQAIEKLKEANAKRALMLPLSVPVHCKLLQPIASTFKEKLTQYELKTPSIPIIHNVDAKTKSTPAEIQQALVEQIYSPVNWVQCMQNALENTPSLQTIAECGPGKVLWGLNRRILKTVEHFSLYDNDSMQKFTTHINA